MSSSLYLLHGALGATDQVTPLAEALSNTWNANVTNFPGHGGRAIPEILHLEHFAEDVLQHMDNHGVNRAHFFGYSMGGYVALLMAHRHPERVGKIITLGTKWDWNPAGAEREARMLQPLKMRDKVPAFCKMLAERHAPVPWDQLVEATARMMLAMGHRPPLTSSEAATIPHPVLVLRGSEDNMVSAEESQALANALINGRFATLNDCPHPLERVDLKALQSAIEAHLHD